MFATISSRFNTLLLMLLVLMAAAMIAILARGSSAGPLDPPTAPASTLPQVEPRSPIPPVGWNGTSPITIGSPGSYFLTRNLNQVPITIAAENLTLDLNGFTLIGNSGIGITATAGTKRNIVIRNGTLLSWQVAAISLRDVTRSTFSDLHISGSGEGLTIGTGNVVSRVESTNNSLWGINVQPFGDVGGSIDQSNFSGNADCGICLEANNVAVRNSVIDANGKTGIYVTGSWNDITDSRIIGNGFYGVDFRGNRNVAVHNHIDGNLYGPVSSSGAGNIFGPISSTGGTDPSQNIGFP